MGGYFHYTCDHGADGIRRDGLVWPGAALGVKFPQAQFAWFTDLDAPNREALGLSSHVLHCDRTTHRFDVTDARRIFPWMTIRNALPDLRDLLEGHDGAMPRHWFVAVDPVRVVEAVRRG